jgi:hypothetical protein
MSDLCDLHAANGNIDAKCEAQACPFWRVVEHVSELPAAGCAIKHYQLLGKDDIAAWLLSVRVRLERLEAEKCADTDG